MSKRKYLQAPPQVSDPSPDLEAEAPSADGGELALNFEEMTEASTEVTLLDEHSVQSQQVETIHEGAPPVESEDDAESEPHLMVEAGVGSGSDPVQRMTTQVKQFLDRQVHGKALVAVVAAGLVSLIWLYQQIPGPPAPPDKTVELALESGLKEARAQVAEQQDKLKNLTEKVETLTQDMKLEREHTQARFQEVSGRLAETIRQKLAPAAPEPAAAEAASVLTAQGAVQPTEAMAELLLLKERNRLTDYADKAIATGSRDALQAVVEAMFDPERQKLHHAAQAEFRRVQAFYEISSSIDPAYKLPLLELFKDGSVKSEAEITPARLIALMKDSKQPWEVRLRCAYLLRESPDKDVNAALLQVLKEDASLDVAKQAQTSLERRLGKRFRLFDIPTVEAWMLAHPQN